MWLAKKWNLFFRWWIISCHNTTIQKSSILKYQKLDLENGEIAILSVKEFGQDVAELSQNGYELSILKELYDFVEHKTIIPDKVFVILMDYEIPHPVKMLTVELLKHKKSIIFFKPLLQRVEKTKHHPEITNC